MELLTPATPLFPWTMSSYHIAIGHIALIHRPAGVRHPVTYTHRWPAEKGAGLWKGGGYIVVR